MVLLVVMTGEAGFTPGNRPCMWRVAGSAAGGRVRARLVETDERLVAGGASLQGLDLSFFDVAGVAAG